MTGTTIGTVIDTVIDTVISIRTARAVVRVARAVAFTACATASVVPAARAQFTPPVRDMGPHAGVILSDSIARAHAAGAGLGWVLPISRDFTHATPKTCRMLVELIDHQLLRWTGWDTVEVGTRADTLTSEAFAFGRECSAHFTAQNVESRELTDLLLLAIQLHNHPFAYATLDRQVREAKTPLEHGMALRDGSLAFLTARPKQRATAESLLVRFDALQRTHPWWKVMARYDVLISSDTFDTTGIRHLYRENAIAYQSLPIAMRTFLSEQSGGGAERVAEIDALADVPVKQRCDQLAEAYIAWPQTAQPEDPRQLKDYDPTSKQYAELIRRTCLMDTLPERRSFPALPARTWFAAGSTTPIAAPAWPTPGRLTLLLETPLGSGRPTSDLVGYRRLYEKYHAQGLDAVLVARVRANRLWAAPPQPPDVTAKMVAWYFHDYLKMPMPVLVIQSDEPYASAALYGRDGKAVTTMHPPMMMEEFVRKALGLPTQ